MNITSTAKPSAAAVAASTTAAAAGTAAAEAGTAGATTLSIVSGTEPSTESTTVRTKTCIGSHEDAIPLNNPEFLLKLPNRPFLSFQFNQFPIQPYFP